ncbi:hydroxyproline-rich glycoprotein family protein [Medicago truncatula]|uniref:Hydroxyproline-rich glycoprotein family protein n=2 Tax=Medicago truncatula TaxID=3880 RepID=G7KZH9_MEDTR|nr:hydroxyproline-rich glycoprotein family protein [Medicago truncatula]
MDILCAICKSWKRILSLVLPYKQPETPPPVLEESSWQSGLRKHLSIPKKQKWTETINPPFPWATCKRAKVYTIHQLLSEGFNTIGGTVQCKQCGFQRVLQFDLKEKFDEVVEFIEKNKYNMHDRAPKAWMNPVLPKCDKCGQENAMNPIITKKRTINWLFLLLGQMIGCCKLQHLKYFCKHTNNLRISAKDRLIYLTYVDLCKQLQPDLVV